MSGEPDGREYRELLLRLLDGVREDIVALRTDHGNTDAIARDALAKVETMRAQLDRVELEAKASTLSIVEIKTAARGAGMIAGAVLGALASVLTAFVMKALGVS